MASDKVMFLSQSIHKLYNGRYQCIADKDMKQIDAKVCEKHHLSNLSATNSVGKGSEKVPFYCQKMVCNTIILYHFTPTDVRVVEHVRIIRGDY